MSNQRSRLAAFLVTAAAIGPIPLAIGQENDATGDVSQAVLAQAADESVQARLRHHGEVLRSMAFMEACGSKDLFQQLNSTVSTYDWMEKVTSEVSFCAAREKKTGQTCALDKIKSTSDRRILEAYVKGAVIGTYKGFQDGISAVLGIPELKDSFCHSGVKVAQDVLTRKRK